MGSSKLGRWGGSNNTFFSPEGQPGTLVGGLSLSLQMHLFFWSKAASGHHFPASEKSSRDKFREGCLSKEGNHKVTCITSLTSY